MLDIACCTKVGVCLSAAGYSIRFELTDKQQYLAAAFHMVNVALTSRRILCRRALALPMEQALINGIVVVHGCGRIVFVSLVGEITEDNYLHALFGPDVNIIDYNFEVVVYDDGGEKDGA